MNRTYSISNRAKSHKSIQDQLKRLLSSILNRLYAAGKFFYVRDIDKNLKDSSHQINSLELLDFDKSSLSNMRDSHRCSYILVGFQIDAFWSASDWLIFNEQRSDWLTVFSGQHLFKNPYMNIKLWLLDWITKLW